MQPCHAVSTPDGHRWLASRGTASAFKRRTRPWHDTDINSLYPQFQAGRWQANTSPKLPECYLRLKPDRTPALNPNTMDCIAFRRDAHEAEQNNRGLGDAKTALQARPFAKVEHATGQDAHRGSRRGQLRGPLKSSHGSVYVHNIYIYSITDTHTHTYMCVYIYIYDSV